MQGIVRGLPGHGRRFVRALRCRLVGLAGREGGGDCRFELDPFGVESLEVDLGAERLKRGPDACKFFIERLRRF